MIFADSNIWIFSEIAEYPEHNIALEKLASYREEGIFINAIIISEVFHKLSLLIGIEESVNQTRKILSSKSVVYLPIEKETLEKSFELTKELKINDAIIAQHAIESKTPLFTDDTKHFKKIKGLKVIQFR